MDKHRISHHLALRPRRGDRHATLGEVGFTIIEILVSVAVLGIIVVPMAMAFSAGFRVTELTGASLNASANRDQLAFRFSTDVASVDATGASRSGATCDTTPSGGGSLLITLNNTTQATATAVSNRVSYWVTGSGVNINIARRACTNATPGVAATGGRETIVSEKLGFAGAVATDVVHGPYDPAIGALGSPCDEYRCQLEIDGRYRLRVTAQRRAFGAGVPLEIGKIYSSWETYSHAGSIVLYEHTNGAGLSRGVEQRFTNQITLAGGLDGPPLLYASFAVQQKLTGNWLTCPTPGVFTNCSFTAGSKGYIDGQFSSNVWKLPLRLGPGEVMAGAGEYRVYTQLRAGPSAPPKAYGGSNGFPLWVDWYPQDSVFVKPAANGGNDANNGLTPATAVATINQALLVSKTQNRGEIQVAKGDYAESVVVNGANYADYRTLTGGHDPTNWMRGGFSPMSTKIIGAGVTGIGYRINNKKFQRFRQVGIQSGIPPATPLNGPGASTWGMIVEGGTTMFMKNSSIFASPGGNGSNGSTPVPKGDACLGGNGVGQSTATVTNRVSAGYRATTWNGFPYNAAPIACGQTDNRRAGNGGGGGDSGLFYADNGAAGSAGAGASPAAGGSGGAGGFCDGKQGNPGQGGATDTAVGPGGTAGLVNLNWTGTGYVGSSGSAGASGGNGHGGGGAGGAGATNCFGVNARGSSGGSGGEGGLAGDGGTGGTYGGASVGLLIDGTGSVALLENSRVTASGGGRGGNGGNGGEGGRGGVGGRGGSNAAIIGENSGGGGGGSGGNGGGGGAAGQGGMAVDILFQNGGVQRLNADSPSTPTPGANGTPGTGGAGGDGGPGGLGGSSSLTIFWIFTINFGAGAGGSGFKGQSGANGASAPAPPAGCHVGGRTSGNALNCVIV